MRGALLGTTTILAAMVLAGCGHYAHHGCATAQPPDPPAAQAPAQTEVIVVMPGAEAPPASPAPATDP